MRPNGRILIVHGHGNRGEVLTKDAIDRCQALIKFYQSGDLVIITGGIFKKYQLGLAVSHAMRNYIISNSNIPPDSILVEDKSRTTIENVELLKRNFGKKLMTAKEVIYITSGYHVPRCQYIWDNLAPELTHLIICPARPWQKGLSFGKVLVEIMGLMVTACYLRGVVWPENFFRRIARTV